jgi:hypothetical protein
MVTFSFTADLPVGRQGTRVNRGFAELFFSYCIGGTIHLTAERKQEFTEAAKSSLCVTSFSLPLCSERKSFHIIIIY